MHGFKVWQLGMEMLHGIVWINVAIEGYNQLGVWFLLKCIKLSNI